ncbi:MAG: cupin domain-containing protein [Calditrichales bacterium]|nr:MAG: cupin domain-containing protein [Calditrichales bacterium]
MSVKNINDLPYEGISAGAKASRQVLISSEEAPNFAMRRFVIKAGGYMPEHTNTVEHEQYVLGGSALITIGDKQYNVSRDDIVFIPAGVPHSYKVMGETDFQFLCLIPNKPDVITLK